MKIYDIKVIPEKQETYVKLRICDLCGRNTDKEDWSGEYYEINQTEVKVIIRGGEGINLPEEGNGIIYEVDICPNCFKNELVPWLQSKGAKIKPVKWNW